MREYIDVTGRTEEEAIQKALEQLGLDRDEVSVEILERAKAGFLGFGSAPAKVRIRYGEEEPETPSVSAEPPKPEKKPEERPEEVEEERQRRSAKRQGSERKKAERASRREEAPNRPEREKAKEQPARQEEAPRVTEKTGKAKKGKPSKPVAEASPASPVSQAAPAGAPQAAATPDTEADDEKSAAIRTFLTGLLSHMGQEAAVRVYLTEDGRYKVILEGQGMGALIGRRGETLDAIQQLTNYAVNRGGNRVRIQLDAEGYREKREKSLRNLARKEASKVVKYRRSRTLEPMNAYERHVIHTALQEYPGVTTYSTGTDPNRRVIVAYDREKL